MRPNHSKKQFHPPSPPLPVPPYFAAHTSTRPPTYSREGGREITKRGKISKLHLELWPTCYFMMISTVIVIARELSLKGLNQWLWKILGISCCQVVQEVWMFPLHQILLSKATESHQKKGKEIHQSSIHRNSGLDLKLKIGLCMVLHIGNGLRTKNLCYCW